MKILVIFTGGTIGSEASNGWISPNKKTKKILIENYLSNYDNDICFDTIEPYTILSENLSAKELNLLIKLVCENVKKDYAGIIITHGTDTLQYSTVALSYALGNESMPVLFVSANYPLNDARSNGNINFSAAVDFIKGKHGTGVFAVYSNDGQKTLFHRGFDLLTHDETDDTLKSINNNVYAYCTRCGIKKNTNHLEHQIKAMGCYCLPKKSGILVIKSHPGDCYSYNFENYKAIIIMPYHSGTLDTTNNDFIEFCMKAKEKGVPIYVVNVGDGVAYESTKVYKDLGITIRRNATFISTYIGLWIENK